MIETSGEGLIQLPFQFTIRVKGNPKAFQCDLPIQAWIRVDKNTEFEPLLMDMSERAQLSPSYISPFIKEEGTWKPNPEVRVDKYKEGVVLSVSTMFP